MQIVIDIPNNQYKKLVNPYQHNEMISTRLKEIVRNGTPLPKGHWVGIEYDGYADGNPVYDTWECSECGWEHNGEDDTLTCYCPNCGAKMEEENE